MKHHAAFGIFFLVLAAVLTLPPGARGEYWTVDATFDPTFESIPSSNVQPSGRAYPGGKFLTSGTIINGQNFVRKLARLSADGTIDTTFSPPVGVAVTVVYPDGRILASTPIAPNYTSFLLQRLLGDGSIDPTFSPVVLEGGAGVVLLGDDRLLLRSGSGGFRVDGGPVKYMAMLTADGALDDSFKSPLAWNNFSPSIVSVKITSDGQHIIVVGSALHLGTGLDQIARLNLDGSVDATFNAGGSILSTAYLTEVYSTATGALLVVDRGNIIRLMSTGAADVSFVPTLVGSNFDFGPQQPDGKVFYRSLVSGQNTSRQLRRMNSDGSDDPTFTVISTPYGATYEISQPILSGDGTFYVGTATAQRDAAHLFLTHVLMDGSIDPAFNPRFGVYATLSAYARQPDGKHVVAGRFAYVNNVAMTAASTNLVRLNDDGALDSSFNATLPSSSSVTGLFVQPSGKLLVFGRFPDGQGGYNCLLRLGVDGSADSSFPPSAGLNYMAMDTSGYVYGITAGSASHLLRYSPEGIVDSTFPSFATNASQIVPLSDGAVMLETSVVYYGIPTSLVRLLHDGTVDANFKSPVGGSDKLLGLAALPDGKVLICVQIGSSSLPSNNFYRLSRLLATGTIDYGYTTMPGNSIIWDSAGPLFDLLRAGSPNVSTSAGLDLTKNFDYYDLNCRTDGQLMVRSTYPFTSGSPLLRYLRTALTSPSVDALPRVMSSPQSRVATRMLNDVLVISEQATGVEPFTYQWMKDGNPLVGKTAPFLLLQDLQASDEGVYALKISNFYGSVTAPPTTLTIDTTFALVSITSQPVPQNVATGASASFNVTATGLPAPTYQWYKDSAPINDATGSSYMIANVVTGDAGTYRVKVANGVSTVWSGEATLSINFAPVITLQPVSQRVNAGTPVTFTAAASGPTAPTYQWRKNGVNIGGATNASYNIAKSLAGDLGIYSVVVTNSYASVISDPAALSFSLSGGGPVPLAFDVLSYLTRYPDVAAAFGSDSYGVWLYYRDFGIYQGEIFDEELRVEEYLALYPDLFAVFGDDLGAALVHWLTIGRIEGRLGRVPLEFSAAGYFARNPDVATAVGNDPVLAWGHYWLYGIYEGRAYDDELRVFEYLAINADLTAAFVNDWRQAALHWMRYGRTEGRLGRLPLTFNVAEYLVRSPDVAAVWGTNPTTVFLHYWAYGIDEGRTYDDIFRPVEYLALNPDLAAALGTDRRLAFKHWVRYGQSEGRPGRNP